MELLQRVINQESRLVSGTASSPKSLLTADVCYKPASLSTPEQNELRKECVKNYDNTSHDPIFFRPTGTRIFGPKTSDETHVPKTPAVLSDRAKQLAGVLAY